MVTLFEDSVDTKWMLSTDDSAKSTGGEEETRRKGWMRATNAYVSGYRVQRSSTTFGLR